MFGFHGTKVGAESDTGIIHQAFTPTLDELLFLLAQTSSHCVNLLRNYLNTEVPRFTQFPVLNNFSLQQISSHIHFAKNSQPNVEQKFYFYILEAKYVPLEADTDTVMKPQNYNSLKRRRNPEHFLRNNDDSNGDNADGNKNNNIYWHESCRIGLKVEAIPGYLFNSLANSFANIKASKLTLIQPHLISGLPLEIANTACLLEVSVISKNQMNQDNMSCAAEPLLMKTSSLNSLYMQSYPFHSAPRIDENSSSRQQMDIRLQHDGNNTFSNSIPYEFPTQSLMDNYTGDGYRFGSLNSLSLATNVNSVQNGGQPLFDNSDNHSLSFYTNDPLIKDSDDNGDSFTVGNEKVINPQQIMHGTKSIDGRDVYVLDGDLHITGDLFVDGEIHGQLVTGEGEADYAEWFPFLISGNDALANASISPGDIVQLRSPEQKITKDTSHADLGPLLVVSTSPCVAAGKPRDNNDLADPGAFCAFLGQVPIKVHGPIKCGDLLFPSGLNDGRAISHDVFYASPNFKSSAKLKAVEPVGTALEECGEGNHLVLCFVRWQHSTKDRLLKEQNREFDDIKTSAWLTASFLGLEIILSANYFISTYNIMGRVLLALQVALMGLFLQRTIVSELKVWFDHYDTLSFVFITEMRLIYCSFCCINAASMAPAPNTWIHLFLSILGTFLNSSMLLALLNAFNTWRHTFPESFNQHALLKPWFDMTSNVVELFPNSYTRRLKGKKEVLLKPQEKCS